LRVAAKLREGFLLKVREMSFLVSDTHEAVSDTHEAVSDTYEAVSDVHESVPTKVRKSATALNVAPRRKIFDVQLDGQIA